MRWLLVHREQELGEAWKEQFSGLPDVDIISDDICSVNCDAVVSPANSFGFMDGGLDHALSERFGWNLQETVQQLIAARPLRELLVGESLIIPTEDDNIPWLIVAPTMRVPMRLRQSINAYLAMKAILTSALDFDGSPPIEVVAIPGLGTGVGNLPYQTAAIQMWTAFSEIMHEKPPYPDDFGEAQKRHLALNEQINLWDPDP